MNKQSQVVMINEKIKQELTAETSSALLATTFKGLNASSMKQAIMEGMIRGFEFKDFLEKDVYAIPFGGGYSLVTSIDYMRKIASRSGLAGKSAPRFTNDNGKVESCSVTVKKVLKNGEIGEFESLVYFDEYTTGKNLWVKKPRTMLAKVAEMHALRMAFPEELSKAYIEDEMKQDVKATAKVVLSQDEIESAKKDLDKCTTIEVYDKTWKDFPKEVKENEEIMDHALNVQSLINEAQTNENK